jgi:transketolase
MKASKIIKISKKLGLSHLSSCLSTLPVLEAIYKIKKETDLVLLDNAHAHLAHLMFINLNKAEKLRERYGAHCDTRSGCVINGGSLGHALGIGIGMALVNRQRDIYVILSDGSIMEGSNWEALRIKQELKLENLKCYFNFNGFTALSKCDRVKLSKRVMSFCPDAVIHFTSNGGYDGIDGHYCKA